MALPLGMASQPSTGSDPAGYAALNASAQKLDWMRHSGMVVFRAQRLWYEIDHVESMLVPSFSTNKEGYKSFQR